MRGGTTVRKRIVRHGNSRAIVIEKAILELLHIDDETELEMTTDGRSLLIAPVESGEERSARLRAISEQVMDENAELFDRLSR